MKNKYAFLPLVAMLGFFLGCGELDKLTQFKMDYNTQFTVPATLRLGTLPSIPSPDIETNAVSTFKSNNTHKDLIEEVKLIELQLVLNNPANGNFDYLKSIAIFISAEGLSDTRIAWKEVVPDGVSTLALDTSNENIKEYIKKDKFVLKTTVVTDKMVEEEQPIDLHAVLFVDAKIIGV